MRKTVEGSITRYSFDSINDVVSYIHKTKRTPRFQEFVNSKGSYSSISKGHIDFFGTSNFDEAEDLLLHGWDCKAKELKSKIGASMGLTGHTVKPTYSVYGYQACVPRYLQGIPDSMIYSKRVAVKNKVINILKQFDYCASTKPEKILEESIKVLQIVQSLESKGYRVNLGIYVTISIGDSIKFCVPCTIRIKQASQRLNIKQLAFPLVHPSMFRRIIFSLIERFPETERNIDFYSYVFEYEETKNHYKGNYVLPAFIDTDVKDIKDLDKYYVE